MINRSFYYFAFLLARCKNVKTGLSEWIPAINKIVMSYDSLHTSQKKKKKNKMCWKQNGILMLQRTMYQALCYI